MNSYSHIYLTPITWSKHNSHITRIGKNKVVKTKASDYGSGSSFEAEREMESELEYLCSAKQIITSMRYDGPADVIKRCWD